MAIPSEDDSTKVILAESRYHRASLKADARTVHLNPRTEAADAALRRAETAEDEADGARIDAFALFVRSDVDLDEECRAAEIAHLAAVRKNREDAAYRAVWPNGLSDLIASRGAEQARAVRAAVTELGTHAPAIHAAHQARLLELATLTETRETAWRNAETAAAQAFANERIGRVGLIEQLRKNEGALREIFPNDRNVARSFYRSDRRGKKKAKADPVTG